MPRLPAIVGRNKINYHVGPVLDDIASRVGPFESIITTDDTGLSVSAARWAWSRGLPTVAVPRPVQWMPIPEAIRRQLAHMLELGADLVLGIDTSRRVDELVALGVDRGLPCWRCEVDWSTEWTPRLTWVQVA